MSTTTFNFDNYFKALPNFSTQSQAVSRILMDATNDIVKEQAAAAETAIDYSMKMFRLPEASEPTEFLADKLQQQRELLEAMGGSAERILTIASDAGNKAFTAFLETGEEAAA